MGFLNECDTRTGDTVIFSALGVDKAQVSKKKGGRGKGKCLSEAGGTSLFRPGSKRKSLTGFGSESIGKLARVGGPGFSESLVPAPMDDVKPL